MTKTPVRREIIYTLPAPTDKQLEATVAMMQAEGYEVEILDAGTYKQSVRGRKKAEHFEDEDP
jgi:hypothetical protein